MQGIVSFYLTSLVVVIVIAAYLLPTLVAWLRHAPDIAAVAVINSALGWTVLYRLDSRARDGIAQGESARRPGLQ